MGFILSRRSLKNLEGVHEDLVMVVQRALEITEVDFTVIEGVRSHEKQAQPDIESYQPFLPHPSLSYPRNHSKHCVPS